MAEKRRKRPPLRKRMYQIINVSSTEDRASQIYDLFNALSILVNLAVSILYTYEPIRAQYGHHLLVVENLTVTFFALDYALRLWTATYRYPDLSAVRCAWRYTRSASGIVDLLSFLPYCLPVFFPTGAVAFRMFRVMRIFRLFRINAYYDSLSVITEVITGKAQQLLSSVFIILVLMLASSLCMYSLEHEAQPEVFTNAFSGIWWSVSTLLTVGYGDIYPITTMGKIFGILISFLGVGMVAIPTGIISAGFVDQYSRIKQLAEFASEDDIQFIRIRVKENDRWAGSTVMELGLPAGVLVAAIHRSGEVVIPRGDTRLLAGDTVVLGAESLGKEQQRIRLKELTLQEQSPWNGQRIRDLDISRQTIIIMVRRKGSTFIPGGNTLLQTGDTLVIYSKEHIRSASTLEI